METEKRRHQENEQRLEAEVAALRERLHQRQQAVRRLERDKEVLEARNQLSGDSDDI